MSADAPAADLAPAVEEAVATTIETIDADPAKYYGKPVRIRGLIGACTTPNCEIVPVAPGTRIGRDRAMPMMFSDRPGAPQMAYLYRFSEVTVEGRYDRAGLTVDRVVTVHKSWSALNFFDPGDKPGNRLTAPPPKLAEALLAAYTAWRDRPGSVAPDPNTTPYRSFVDPTDAGAPYFCFCRSNDCDGEWPMIAEQLLVSPANPYSCAKAEKQGSLWQFPATGFR